MTRLVALALLLAPPLHGAVVRPIRPLALPAGPPAILAAGPAPTPGPALAPPAPAAPAMALPAPIAPQAAPSAPIPLPLGSRTRATASLFDIDGNILLRLPTKTIVFHKETGAELPLSNEEFSRVQEKIGREDAAIEAGGRAANARDYEFRRGPGGSFREARDTPDGNNFITGVKWVVENLPKDQWQGPSWKAFARALRDPETAAQVAIVTARGHRPESILEAFAYLRDLGYIKRLPPLENIHAVGETGNPSLSKVEVVKDLLDRIQAAPLSSGGKKYHSAGFSDDEWKNFTTMAAGLAAALREDPARWSRVKIVLFYTGHGRAHKRRRLTFRPVEN